MRWVGDVAGRVFRDCAYAGLGFSLLLPVVFGPYGRMTMHALSAAAGPGGTPTGEGLAWLAMVGEHALLVADLVACVCAVSLALRLAWPATAWTCRAAWRASVRRQPGILVAVDRVSRVMRMAMAAAAVAFLALVTVTAAMRFGPLFWTMAQDPRAWPSLAMMGAMLSWGLLRSLGHARRTAATAHRDGDAA